MSESGSEGLIDSPPEALLFARAMLVICIAHVPLVIYLLWVGSASIVLAGLLAMQAVGLYRRVQWGRRMLKIALWLAVILGLGLMFPARFEGIDLKGAEPPSAMIAGLQAFLVCSAALVALHFLGKNKHHFRAKWF